jgi:hypothetical protein
MIPMLHRRAFWEHQALTHGCGLDQWHGVGDIFVAPGCVIWYTVTFMSRLV